MAKDPYRTKADVEPEALEPLTAEKITELRSKHGAKLTAIESAVGWLIFRKPNRHEYQRFIDKIAADRGSTWESGWEIAQSTLVEPGPQGLTDAIEAEPSILIGDILPAIHALAGEDKQRQRVKL